MVIIFFLTRFECKEVKYSIIVLVHHIPYTEWSTLSTHFATCDLGSPIVYLNIASTFPQQSFDLFSWVYHWYRKRDIWDITIPIFTQISSFEIFSQFPACERLSGIIIISDYSIDVKRCIVFSFRTSERNVNIFSISRTFLEL